MLTFIFFGFVAYLLFKLIFDFVIPIYKTTRQVKQRFRDMHNHMNGKQTQAAKTQPTKTEKKPVGDYIDFEEVKDE